MMASIREEIERIEASAKRIKMLADGNHALERNADIILTFVYLLNFITPDRGKEEI